MLVTLVKTGECPVCDISRADMGDINNTRRPRDINPVLDALNKIGSGAQTFVNACKDIGIKAIPIPFWQDLPFVNIYSSITPDILYQLYQGVIKHLILWLIVLCGHTEINACSRCLPMNHHIHHFMKGISGLSCVTGTEHDQICRFLLGIVHDIQLPSGYHNGRLIQAVRNLLDFVYLARYPIYTTHTLDQLEDALTKFHSNATVFIDLGICSHLNLPKLHFCSHYQYLIEYFGTTDNYNTKYMEHLHIDLAKDAYRATNFRDEISQMTTWVHRKEQILQHDQHIQSIMTYSPLLRISDPPCFIHQHFPYLPKFPSISAVSMKTLEENYGATFFQAALCRFIAQYQNPALNLRQIEEVASTIHLHFFKVPVYHFLKFRSHSPYDILGTPPLIVDSIYAKPTYKDKKNDEVSGRFDVALVHFRNTKECTTIEGNIFNQQPTSTFY